MRHAGFPVFIPLALISGIGPNWLPYLFTQVSSASGPTAHKMQAMGLTATTSPTVLDNWKVYSNDEYGFELRYPLDWKLEGLKGYRTTKVGPASFIFRIRKLGPTQHPGGLSFDDGAILEFGGAPRYSAQVADYVAYPGKFSNGSVFTAYGFEGSYKVADNQDETELVSAYRLLPSGPVILFSWQRVGGKVNDLSYQKYLLPILSTFKLIR